MDNLTYGGQPAPQLNLPPEKSSSGKLILITVVIALLFLIIGATAGYLLSARFIIQKEPAVANSQATAGDTASTSASALASNQEVLWSAPQELAVPKSLFLPVEPGLGSRTSQAYLIGKFSAGRYQGADLVLVSSYPEGPAMYPSYFRFAKQGDNFVLLQKNSDILGDEYKFDKSRFSIDSSYQIKELAAPEQLIGPKGEILQRDEYAKVFFSLNNLRLAFNDRTYGDIYTTNVSNSQSQLLLSDVLDRNGFYLRLPDGTTAVYKLTGEMFDESVAPKITWSDGMINTQTYSHTDVSGCGSGNYASVVDLTGIDLKKIGQTANGEPVMAPADSANSYYYKNIYDTKYQVLDGQNKLSYKDFLASKPLFFWTDSFGRMIKFESTKFQPMAECGKPVIYLYPTATADVSVKLAPEGGFSHSEPAYNGGWNVEAEPSGKLTDLSTGKNYPYLFWEGRGGQYGTPDRGFVVKRSEVKSLLIDKLSQYNLNAREISDFLEFWLPRMQAKPYYFITFLGTAEMDRLAPLSISPKPDTIIRVLMDFTPLDAPRPAIGYEISAPTRNGFTIIEWGGVLRK